MLAGNKLTHLPEELQNCKELALLRVSANNLKKLPEWLYSMPKLAWLAFSGNSFNRSVPIRHESILDLNDFALSAQLGEGASGTIYKAVNKANADQVAVKIFKGEVTSDGYPEDEMNAYIGAGDHSGLVKLLGEIKSANKKGLVMKLIPSHFYNLGKPPSLVTCTRDVFSEDIKLNTAQVLKIASTIASVGEQLHSKGINHGDLYAHNIMIDKQGNSLFGDFGAASFYDRQNKTQSFYLERVEVKAYGYLLDDLISLCEQDSTIELKGLRDNCLSPDINHRPGFKELVLQLQQFVKP